MKINIVKIYENNIAMKFNASNRSIYEKTYTPKQREMWEFTLELIKDNYPVEEYDSEINCPYLNKYHDTYMLGNVVKFSLNDWFVFLASNA